MASKVNVISHSALTIRTQAFELQIYAIGPPKAILIGIFSTSGGLSKVHYIIFFHHFASLLEYFIIVSNPPPFQFFGSLVKSVITKANVCQILQWRPTIRKVPLLPTLMKRGNHPTWLQKAFDNMFMNP